MNKSLTECFTKEEIVQALRQMTPLKSPRPDDFSLSFYQFYWHIVGEEVTNVVLKFLNDGVFHECINFTYIVMILKVKDPVNAFDFRPLSLCNFIYKLVSKVPTNRLK